MHHEHQQKHKKIVVAIALLAGVLSSACLAPSAQAQMRGSVDIRIGTPPPAPRYEQLPPPRRGYVWAPGYWAWDGHRYVWAGGHWERARHGYRYAPPVWRQAPGGWVLDRGGWAR